MNGRIVGPKTMARLRTCSVLSVVVLAAGCATFSPPTKPATTAGEPDLETQQAVFNLMKLTAICLRSNQPNQPGELVMVGVFSEPGRPLEAFDTESTAGNERATACVVEQAGRIKSPRSPPSRFVLYVVPLPFRAEGIRMFFPTTEPARKRP